MTSSVTQMLLELGWQDLYNFSMMSFDLYTIDLFNTPNNLLALEYDFCSRPRLTQPYNHIIYPGKLFHKFTIMGAKENLLKLY